MRPFTKISSPNRHWYRHMIVYYSPSGVVNFPFPIWLDFTDRFPVNSYHLGMVRDLLFSQLQVGAKSREVGGTGKQLLLTLSDR